MSAPAGTSSTAPSCAILEATPFFKVWLCGAASLPVRLKSDGSTLASCRRGPWFTLERCPSSAAETVCSDGSTANTAAVTSATARRTGPGRRGERVKP